MEVLLGVEPEQQLTLTLAAPKDGLQLAAAPALCHGLLALPGSEAALRWELDAEARPAW